MQQTAGDAGGHLRGRAPSHDYTGFLGLGERNFLFGLLPLIAIAVGVFVPELGGGVPWGELNGQAACRPITKKMEGQLGPGGPP